MRTVAALFEQLGAILDSPITKAAIAIAGYAVPRLVALLAHRYAQARRRRLPRRRGIRKGISIE